MENKKFPHLNLKPKERLIPHYLTPRMSFYSHLSDEDIKPQDTVFILNEKIESKSLATLSLNLAEIFRNSIKTIISAEEYCKKKHPTILYRISPDRKLLEEKNFSEKIKIIKNQSFLIHEATETIQHLYIHVFDSLREIYKIFGEAIKEQPDLYPLPNKNIKETEEEIIYQTISNEASIKNDYFRNEILNRVLLLQIPSENLRKMSNPTPGVPSDPTVRSKRSQSGGEKANSDQAIIINTIIDYLKKYRINSTEKEDAKKIKKISDLCRKHEEEFTKIIEDYKKSNPDTKHGKTLNEYNVQKNIYKWIKKSDELKSEVNLHLHSD